jgi:hypothetical protein
MRSFVLESDTLTLALSLRERRQNLPTLVNERAY